MPMAVIFFFERERLNQLMGYTFKSDAKVNRCTLIIVLNSVSFGKQEYPNITDIFSEEKYEFICMFLVFV